jgi:hypothetical protein
MRGLDLHCDGSLEMKKAALAGAAQLGATVNFSCLFTVQHLFQCINQILIMLLTAYRANTLRYPSRLFGYDNLYMRPLVIFAKSK